MTTLTDPLADDQRFKLQLALEVVKVISGPPWEGLSPKEDAPVQACRAAALAVLTEYLESKPKES